jgi:hypothetical protein
MSLRETLSNPPPVVAKGPKCQIGLLLLSLPDSEAKALRTAMSDPNWRIRSLHEAIRSEGYDVAYSAVLRHRNSQCQCVALGIA